MSEVFDRVAKWAASHGSRRDALKYLGGFLGGGFLMGAFSGCKQIKQASIFCQSYCAACNTVSSSVYNNCLAQCEVCELTKGTLNPGTLTTCTTSTVVACCYGSASPCGPTSAGVYYCANENTDANNCGACGNVCPSATPGCCSGACTDLTTTSNCGTCGTVCSGTKPACCSGTCADLNSDSNNCGACGTACSSGTTPMCCSGACTDLATDNNNCGACGTVCASGTTCTNGTCM